MAEGLGVTTQLEAFEALGIRLVRGRVVGLAHADGAETAVMAEAVLMATGRQAQFHDLHLDAAGVQTWERGITVDATMRTSASHIWAAGLRHPRDGLDWATGV